MNTLRSVLITPNFGGPDGISMLARQIAGALPQPAAIVSLHDTPPNADQAGGFDMRTASGSRTGFCREIARLIPQCVEATQVVCCHLHLAPAASVLRCRGSRLSVILCGIEAWVPLRPTERWALKTCDLLSISDHTVRRFVAANPSFTSGDVTVVHPGLPDCRDQLDLDPASSMTTLMVGRMAADEGYKGHDTLIDLWPRVIREHSSATLTLVGDGSDRARLEQRAEAAGLSAVVTFTGRVDDDVLADLYRRSRFFAMPSRDEGFGFVFLEAMRAGRACVAARGAAEEIIGHESTGLIADPADPRAVQRALLHLYEDSEAVRRFGQEGRRRYLAAFTADKFHERLRRALDPAMAS